MTRVSVSEAYDNKDVVTQIYRLMDRVDDSTYKSIDVSRSGNNINFTFTLNNDEQKVFSVPDEGVTDVSASSQGSQVTITFTFTDGSTRSFTYTATGGVTVDTEQTITAKKTLTAGLMVTGGETVDVLTVDGDADVCGEVLSDTVSTGTLSAGSAQVSGDLRVHGDTEVEKLTANGDAEIGGAAFEQNDSKDLVISPESRLIVKTSGGVNQELVVGSDRVIVDRLSASTSVSAPEVDADSVVTPALTVSTSATLPSSTTVGGAGVVDTASDQTVNGSKTFSGVLNTLGKTVGSQRVSKSGSGSYWLRVYYAVPGSYCATSHMMITSRTIDGYARSFNGLFFVCAQKSQTSSSFEYLTRILSDASSSYNPATQLKLVYREVNGVFTAELWWRAINATRSRAYFDLFGNYGNYWNEDGATTMTADEFDAMLTDATWSLAPVTSYVDGVTPASDAPDTAVVTKAFVSATDGTTNNLMHTNAASQDVSGLTRFSGGLNASPLQVRSSHIDLTDSSTFDASTSRINFVDKNNVGIANLYFNVNSSGVVSLRIDYRKTDGTYSYGNVIFTGQ